MLVDDLIHRIKFTFICRSYSYLSITVDLLSCKMGCVWSAPAVECMVWTGISDPDFTFPEDRLQEDYGLILDDTGEQLLSVWEGKDNIGVALSGGNRS